MAHKTRQSGLSKRTGASFPDGAAGVNAPRRKVMLYLGDTGLTEGVERWLHHQAQALIAEGNIDPVVVCQTNRPLFSALQAAKIPAYGLPHTLLSDYPMLFALDVSRNLELRTILDTERPDVIHVYGNGPEARWFKTEGYPVIQTVLPALYQAKQAFPDNSPKVGALSRIQYRFCRKAWQAADALVFTTEAECQAMGFEGRATVIPLGLDLEGFVARAQSYPDLDYQQGEDECCRLSMPLHDRESRYVSFINPIDENHHPFAFVDLAEALSQRPGLEDLFYLVIGKGPLEEALCMRIAESPIKGKIHFVGLSDEVPYLLSVSELILHTPVQAGFNLGLVEAMSVGTPTLCTPHPVLAEMLGAALQSCLSPTGALNDMVDRAEALLEPKSGHAHHSRLHGLQGRARHYEASAVMAALTGIYTELAVTSQR